MRLKVTVDGTAYDVDVEIEEEAIPALVVANGTYGTAVPTTASVPAAPASTGSGDGIKAPLSGSVARVPITEGQEVAAGDVLVVLEAMKMETEITAPEAGTVAAVLVAPGDAVTGGQVLVELS